MSRKLLCLITSAVTVMVVTGCNLWNSIFSATDEEAKEAVTLALNVFVDTYPMATRECVEYDGIGLIRYAAADGTYLCEYNSDGYIRQDFNGYQPRFSGYVINGELSPPPGSFGPDGEFTIWTAGDLELSGGEVKSLHLDLSTHGYSHDYRVTEITDAMGSVIANGREIGDIGPWKLEDLMKRNLDILLAIVKIAAEN